MIYCSYTFMHSLWISSFVQLSELVCCVEYTSLAGFNGVHCANTVYDCSANNVTSWVEFSITLKLQRLQSLVHDQFWFQLLNLKSVS